uniref:Hypothetical conserved protein n=1 Tax=uncultured prokaryote TaxID=198431 RepID=H5SCM7_9ZZZZ|nr:hypothetical conserved protein [uncultured prokaryote]
MQVGTLQHIVPLGRYCGLLTADSLALTDLGISFYQLGRQSIGLFSEAMHQLLYTTHYSDLDKRFSWAYAQVVDALWASGERIIDQATVAYLVGMVVDRATQTYDVPAERIAFSHNSVLGIRHWLRALDPPVLSNSGKRETFRRRSYCSPIVLLWAGDALYRITQTPYGVRMFLTPERVEQLCKICVLDPSGLDNVLMLAKRTSDYERGGLFDYSTTGGFGRWLLLARPFSVGSLPEAGER